MAGRHPISTALREAIAADLHAGMTNADAHKKHGPSVTTVAKIRKQEGIPSTCYRPAPVPGSARTIAREMGVSRRQAGKLAKK